MNLPAKKGKYVKMWRLKTTEYKKLTKWENMTGKSRINLNSL